MNGNTIELFLDTNIFLHYPPIKEIEWLKMCECENVNLILCMQVIHELDEKKSDTLLSRRASKSIKEIDSIHSSDKIVSDNVILNIFNYEIKKEDFPEMLSFESKDDRIVYTVKKYIETTGLNKVYICSEDYGMKLRCRANGIECIEPERSTRLQNPRTELEKKYDDIAIKYKKIKENLPVLNLILKKQDTSDGCSTLSFNITNIDESIDIDAKLEEEKTALKIPPSPGSKSASSNFSSIQISGSQYLNSDKQFYTKYISKIDEYLDKFRKYLDDLNSFRKEMIKSIKFIATIENNGSAPASNVDVYLEFPPILAWIKVEKEIIGKRPAFPKRPERPTSYSNFITQSMIGYGLGTSTSDLYHPPLPIFFEKKDVFLSGDVSRSLRIHFEIDKIKHGFLKSFEIEVGFKSFEVCSPFEIDVDISADNIPTGIQKKIPIVVRYSE